MTNKITRRTLARKIGAAASGLLMATPAIAQALLETPEQVEGPFYPPGPLGETDVDLTLLEGHDTPAQGEVILVRGQVTNRNGEPLEGVRVDIWQANDNGRYAHPDDPNTSAALDPNFQGIGIAYTDKEGRYGFKTIKPAAYPLDALGEEGWRAQHIHFKVAPGESNELITQMYFEGDPLLAQDFEIAKVPEDQQTLLITVAEYDEAEELPLHRFDICLA